MHKNVFYVVVCILFALLLVACGATESEDLPGGIPLGMWVDSSDFGPTFTFLPKNLVYLNDGEVYTYFESESGELSLHKEGTVVAFFSVDINKEGNRAVFDVTDVSAVQSSHTLVYDLKYPYDAQVKKTSQIRGEWMYVHMDELESPTPVKVKRHDPSLFAVIDGDTLTFGDSPPYSLEFFEDRMILVPTELDGYGEKENHVVRPYLLKGDVLVISGTDFPLWFLIRTSAID
jgi:hypothetical protein